MQFSYERLESCWEDIVLLMSIHFASLGRPYQPIRERYQSFEDSDCLFAVTARDNGVVVGFALIYVFRSMHNQRVGAQEDMFYLLPTYRKGWNAVRLLKMVEEECARRGADELLMTAEIGSKAGGILLARKYDTVAQQYRKSFSGADSPSTNRRRVSDEPVSKERADQ